MSHTHIKMIICYISLCQPRVFGDTPVSNSLYLLLFQLHHAIDAFAETCGHGSCTLSCAQADVANSIGSFLRGACAVCIRCLEPDTCHQPAIVSGAPGVSIAARHEGATLSREKKTMHVQNGSCKSCPASEANEDKPIGQILSSSLKILSYSY